MLNNPQIYEIIISGLIFYFVFGILLWDKNKKDKHDKAKIGE